MLGGGGEKFVLVVDDPVPAVQVQLRHPEGGDDPSLQRTPEHAPGKHRDAQPVHRGIDKGGGAAGFPGGLYRKAGGQCGGIKGFPGGAALFPQKEGVTPQLLQCHGLAGGEGPLAVVAEYKRAHGLPVYIPEREEAILNWAASAADQRDLAAENAAK